MFENTNWKAVSAEIMGTFFLVFFGVSSLANNAGVVSEGDGTLHILIGLTTSNPGLPASFKLYK